VRSREPEWLAGLAREDQAEDEASHIELQDEIERALLTLTPQQREVLRLHGEKKWPNHTDSSSVTTAAQARRRTSRSAWHTARLAVRIYM